MQTKLEIVLMLQRGRAIEDIAHAAGTSPARVRWYARKLARTEARLKTPGRSAGRTAKNWRRI